MSAAAAQGLAALRALLAPAVVHLLGLAAALLCFAEISRRDDARATQAALLATREALATLYAARGRPALIDDMDARLRAAEGGQLLLLAAPNGRILSGNLDRWPALLAGESAGQTVTLADPRGGRGRDAAVVSMRLAGGERLLVGRVEQNGASLVARLAAAGALGFGLWLIGVAPLFLARRRRWAELAASADAIGRGDSAVRFRTAGRGDPLAPLTEALNAMTERLHQTIADLRFVIDSLAHDVGAGLTRTRALVRQARIDQPGSPPHDPLHLADQHLADLGRTLAVAIEISRAEAGQGRAEFEPVDLRRLLTDLVELFDAAAELEAKQLQAMAPDRLVVPLNRQLVSQALANLVENALRHSGGTTITVAAAREQDQLVLEVTDSGAGIPADRLSEARRRFGRLDSRAPGSGLGLTLVEAVARMHGGRLLLEDAGPGLRARMLLPAPCTG